VGRGRGAVSAPIRCFPCAFRAPRPGTIGAVLRAVTSLVAPPLCALCGDPCEYRDSICSRCDRRVAGLWPTRSVLPCGLEVISAARYEGVAKQLVTKIKFAARLTLAEVAAERMVRAWGATRRGELVPVPPAPARARARGYDPANALARLICERTWAQLVVDLVRDDGPRQVGRPRTERIADPPRITRVDDDIPLSHSDIWLVDDVVTTGATLSACAAVLREAGAERVRALTFARAEEPPPQQRRGSASSSGLRLTGLGAEAAAA
jgi:ComF family protein